MEVFFNLNDPPPPPSDNALHSPSNFPATHPLPQPTVPVHPTPPDNLDTLWSAIPFLTPPNSFTPNLLTSSPFGSPPNASKPKPQLPNTETNLLLVV